MPDPRNRIAQGAYEVEECPVEGCTYVPKHYADYVIHMWKVHREDVQDRGTK